MGAKMAGAKRIIGIDVNPEKEKIAREFGSVLRLIRFVVLLIDSLE